jgi:hypothetical protein
VNRCIFNSPASEQRQGIWDENILLWLDRSGKLAAMQALGVEGGCLALEIGRA